MYTQLVFLLIYGVGQSISIQSKCLLELSDSNSTTEVPDCQNVTIVLVSDFVLSDTINISHMGNLSVIGSGHTITCNNFSGIIISYVTRVLVEDLKLYGCGVQNKYANNVPFHSALLIINSSNINISYTVFENSKGTGLVLFNSQQNVHIHNCSFDRGKIPDNLHDAITSGGGGMYVEQLCTDQPTNFSCGSVNITIENCTFTNNAASNYDGSLGCNSGPFSGLGYGGGLSLRLQKNLVYIKISVISCNFLNNSAIWGGAVEVVMCRAQNVVIQFDKVEVYSNMATKEAGGGFDLELAGLGTTNNSIEVVNTCFYSNMAKYGGGTAISINFASAGFENNHINFFNTVWEENTAHYGSALDVFPSRAADSWTNLPNVTLMNCTFIRNSNCNIKLSLSVGNVQRQGYGTIMIMGFQIYFSGTNIFTSNTGSSIYATGSILIFTERSIVRFENNTAEYGAGIALSGLSYMVASTDCQFIFLNNWVEQYGGGIYFFSIDKHAYIHGDHDFFYLINQSANNVSFQFYGNFVPNDKKNLDGEYRDEPIYPIAEYTKLKEKSLLCLNNDSRYRPDNHKNEMLCPLFISEKGSKYEYYRVGLKVYFIPGMEGLLNINEKLCPLFISENGSKNEYYKVGLKVYFIPGIERVLNLSWPLELFQVILFQNNNSIMLSDNDEYIQNSLTLRGKPEATAMVRLRQVTFEGLAIQFMAELTACPPMYKLIENKTCSCYQNDDLYYTSFFSCFNSENDTYSSISNGYWVNYDGNSSDILVGYCPTGFCNIASEKNSFMVSLPFSYSASQHELDQVVCRNRRGVLCGECVEGTVVHFHSRSFECKATDKCYKGPLFFLIAEILPVTLVFLFLTLLDIKLTSGGVSGFIFFAQMYESINIKLESFIKNDISDRATAFHHILYQLFNFDFLEINSLSFCLWKKATTLDILVLKYVVSLYALLLILSVVILIRICSRFQYLKLRFKTYSVVQVISTFFIIVYSKCTYVSFNILWYQNLYYERSRRHTVVSLQGNLEYFRGSHIPYAITALLVLIFVTVSLPLILVTYPLSNRIIAYLRIEDSPPVKTISKLVPLYKLLPLFDCFQGYYKDKYRFFSGLYFVYRVAILSSLFASQVSVIYLVILMLIIMMILIHVICLPYKRRVHNIIDALFFANLGIITSLKLMMVTITDFSTPKAIHFVHIVEIVFVNIPIAASVGYIIYRGFLKLYQLHKRKYSKLEENNRDFFLSNTVREECLEDYHALKEVN